MKTITANLWVLLTLLGCANSHPIPEAEVLAPPSLNLNMANPASVHCAKLGGESQVRKTSTGDVRYCVLPNGERTEEWELFRRTQ